MFTHFQHHSRLASSLFVQVLDLIQYIKQEPTSYAFVPAKSQTPSIDGSFLRSPLPQQTPLRPSKTFNHSSTNSLITNSECRCSSAYHLPSSPPRSTPRNIPQPTLSPQQRLPSLIHHRSVHNPLTTPINTAKKMTAHVARKNTLNTIIHPLANIPPKSSYGR
jgi:hypothetical protein